MSGYRSSESYRGNTEESKQKQLANLKQNKKGCRSKESYRDREEKDRKTVEENAQDIVDLRRCIVDIAVELKNLKGEVDKIKEVR